MSRHSNSPTMFDDCKTIDISLLKKWGYLVPGKFKSGNIRWSRGGIEVAKINVSVNMLADNAHVDLNYKCNGEKIEYTVSILAKPSNLGKGVLLYFVCPKTGKTCRKLYFVSRYFLHRDAFIGCFYETQTYSHKMRDANSFFRNYLGADHAYDVVYAKHFKKFYAGKFTKRYKKLSLIISKSEQLIKADLASSFRK